MRELLLVRHAQVQPGPPRMDDVHRLSEHGRRQARSLARRLKRAQVKPDVIYSSALLRARQTTEILNAQLNARVELRRDLIEHGSELFLQDCSIQDLVKQHPDKFHDDGEIRYPKSDNGLTWAFSVCGEDMRTLHARARAAWTYIRTQNPLGKPGTVLVVSHGSFLAAFLSELMGLPLQSMWNFSFKNTACVHLLFPAEGGSTQPVMSIGEPGVEVLEPEPETECVAVPETHVG